jgi:hypothetical protein
LSAPFAASLAALSDDLPSSDFDAVDFVSFVRVGASLSLLPDVRATESLSRASVRLGGPGSFADESRGGGAFSVLDESLAERCGGEADGSGVGGSWLAGSAARLLSTSAAKLEGSCEGSGRAGFGGAFWYIALALTSDLTLTT